MNEDCRLNLSFDYPCFFLVYRYATCLMFHVLQYQLFAFVEWFKNSLVLQILENGGEEDQADVNVQDYKDVVSGTFEFPHLLFYFIYCGVSILACTF